MGRLVKNLQLHSGSYAIRVPVGTNVLAPQRPQDGQVRFNKTSNTLEVYYSSLWHAISQTGRVTILKDTFIGDGVTTSFNMSFAPVGAEQYVQGQEAELLVFVGNIYQEPAIAYTVSGSNINFTGAPDFGIKVIVLHNFNSTHVR